jgi:serine/threonine-protein kinase
VLTLVNKLTMTGITMGSIYYMSPEQIQGAATLDARADLYSVGVTLYQLVTGKRPFDGDSQYAIMAAHLEKTPVPPVSIDPSLPRPISDVILMSVTKDPNGRFQTAGAFRNALAAVAATIAGPAAPAFAATPPASGRAPFATAPPVAPGIAAAPGATMPVMAHQPPPSMPPPPMRPPAMAAPPKSGKRGLWMALGGLAVAAAIVGVIEFGPWKNAKAVSPVPQTAAAQPAPQAQPAPTADTSAQPAQPSPSTPPQQDTTPPPQSAPAPSQQTLAAARPAARPAPGGNGQSSAALDARRQETQYSGLQPLAAPPMQQAQQQPLQPQDQQRVEAPPLPAAPAGPSREEVMKAREHSAKLQVRADSIRSSLQSLRRAQQSQGLSLNARFTQPEGLMNTYLQNANQALNAGDLAAAKEFGDKAERQIEILEKLLNQ